MSRLGSRLRWYLALTVFTLLLLQTRMPWLFSALWALPIGAVLVGAIGCFRSAQKQWGLAALIEKGMRRGAGEPSDGERIAVGGTLQPVGDVIVSPLRQRRCLGYRYYAFHYEAGSRTQQGGRGSPRRVVDYSGLGMVPVVVRGQSAAVPVGGYAFLSGFSDLQRITHPTELAEARTRLAGMNFQAAPKEEVLDWIHLEQKEWSGEGAPLIKNYRRTQGAGLIPLHSIERLYLEESFVPEDCAVCAIGVWSSSRAALVGNGTEELVIWQGTPTQVHQTVLSSSRTTSAFGGFLVAAAVALMAWLTLA